MLSRIVIARSPDVSLSSKHAFMSRLRYSVAMSKTEIALIILVILLLVIGFWFILSNQIWVFVSYLETLLYPDIVTPQ
jgi:hypothetical protein